MREYKRLRFPDDNRIVTLCAYTPRKTLRACAQINARNSMLFIANSTILLTIKLERLFVRSSLELNGNSAIQWTIEVGTGKINKN